MNHFKDENIIKQLLEKRVIDMTGQELFDLIGSAVQQATLRDMSEQKEKRILHGKKEIASALTVSTSTISRWLENGTIHAPAVIRADRVLLFDYDLVLEQLQASEGLRWQGKPNGKNNLKAIRHTGLTAYCRPRPDKCRPPGLNRATLFKIEHYKQFLIKFIINSIKKLKTMKKIWKRVLQVALSAAITAVITATVNLVTNKSKTKTQTQAAKDLEAEKLKNAMELEEKRTEERRKRLRDEEEHQRQLWEMREEQRQKRKESSQQSTVDQAFNVPYTSKLAPFKESLDVDARELEWLVGKKIEVGGRSLIYGPAGVGKSALALQWAINIARGTKYGCLPDEEENSHDVQQVILIDLEMSAAEQKARTRGITIPVNLLRNTEPIYNLDELFRMIEHESRGPKATVIIDNIRKLEEEMSQTNQVNEYFSKLEQTQEKLAAKGIIVTFITITHTSKDFDMYKPVQLNDVAGGADLARFSTSVYALIPGHDGKVLFKALKQRNTSRMEDVYVLRIEESPNLHLEYVRTCKEGDALPVKPKKPKTSKGIDKTEASNTVSNKTTDGPMKTKRTLTADEKAEIVVLLEQKVKSAVIAKQFKISLRTVQRIAQEARA